METRGHLIARCAAWYGLREKYIASDLQVWCRNLGFNPQRGLSPEEIESLAIVAWGGEVNGYRASHYYPTKDSYSREEASEALVKASAGVEPGPVILTPPMGEPGDAIWPNLPYALMEWTWPTGRYTSPAEHQDLSQMDGTPSQEIIPETPWHHRVNPNTQGDQDSERPNPSRDMGLVDRDIAPSPRDIGMEDRGIVPRDLARDMEVGAPVKALWERCSLFGVAAYLTLVDRKRVEIRKEVETAALPELLDEGQGQDGYG